MPGTEADYQQITYEQQWGESEEVVQKRLEKICPYEEVTCPAWDPERGCEAKFCFMKEMNDGASI